MVELLSPVGDFECLKAAVQNGANAVYFAAKDFGARAFASNFDDEALEKAINYARLRGVKTNLTLNTLIKEDEFEDAFSLAKKAYEFGIDAIIVQDLGLTSQLIKNFPDLDVHASTQMTVHNLEGVELLKELGFKRAVLSRELSYDEIKYICQNTDMEIEVFVHGALCISYSGQCLFSSMIGGRSGNRGKCAQTCRLPYELLEETSKNKVTLYSDDSSNIEKITNLKCLDKGYLLSTRDLCTIKFLPRLIDAGVTSFKIEGRMKSPEYVATVTRIYRKYIDLALNKDADFIIDENDKIDLMQVFNRGGFSTGHLSSSENKNLVYKEKQNNMGIYLGTISKYNKGKGHVTCKLKHNLSIGDSVSFENENTKYTISELMEKNVNIKDAHPNQEVTFGRMKGNIKINDKIFKISDKKLSNLCLLSISGENIKIPLDCTLKIKSHQEINMELVCNPFNISLQHTYNYIPQPSQNMGLTQEKIITQFSKTQNTVFYFSKFDIDLDDNLFMPISVLNDIRRTGIELIEKEIINSFKRTSTSKLEPNQMPDANNFDIKTPKVSLLLNILNLDYDYTSLENIDRLYIPLKYFVDDRYSNILTKLSKKFNLYIYMGIIIRKKYMEILQSIITKAINNFNIKGIVISNLSQLKLINHNNLDIIGNYTLNTYNTYSVNEQANLNIKTTTISPELDEDGILGILKNKHIASELIVYGNTPVMTMNYCPLGKTNKCYKDCQKKCTSPNSKYYLKDRLGILFSVIPDNTQTVTTIYNSKTTSIKYKSFNPDSIRIDILDENMAEINEIITTCKKGQRFEGKRYTNGNLKRPI